jgi:hypothetical protein
MYFPFSNTDDGTRLLFDETNLALQSQRVLSAVGTPKQEWNFTINEIIHCNPAIAELGGDVGLEILFGADDFKVYCLNSTGHQKWTYTTGGDVDAVSVADVDNDSIPEVIAASHDDIYCFNAAGGFEWSYAAPSAIRSTPCLANLDSDPVLEILFGSYHDEFYCIDGTGALEWSFARDYVRASPVVVDIDGSGAPDVLVGDLEEGLFFCLDAGGNQRWARNIGPSGTNPSSCFVTDLDEDNELEILVTSVNSEMYCLNYDGSIRWTYTDVMFDNLCSTPTSADLDEAHGLETIVCSWDEVHCVNSTGGWVWDYDAESVIQSSQCIVDVDGDGKLEIIVGKGDFGVDPGLLCLSSAGVLEWTYSTNTEVESAPCAADVDGDDAIEVFFVSYDTLSDTGIVYCLSVVDAPIQSSSYSWPSIGFMGAVSRTGYYEDSDSDLLIDNYETSAGSSPNHPDTDTDDKNDYLEFLESTDPTLDLIFPSTIDDLVVVQSSSNSVTLNWIAPGDNGVSGTAADYILKYSTNGPITTANWDISVTYAEDWIPLVGGSLETHEVTGLSPSTTYWFALVVADEVPNNSGVSNSPECTTEAATPPITIAMVAGIGLAAVAIVAVVLKRRT